MGDVAARRSAFATGDLASLKKRGQGHPASGEELKTAAYNGHLHILKWFWKRERFPELLLGYHNVCKPATAAGHLDIVMWYLHKDMQRDCHYHQIGGTAGKHRRSHILKWLADESGPTYEDPDLGSVVASALSNGLVDVLDHVLATHGGTVFKTEYLVKKAGFYAAKGGQRRSITWLRDHGCEWHNDYMFFGAARSMDVSFVDWAFQQGCGWPEWMSLVDVFLSPTPPTPRDAVPTPTQVARVLQLCVRHVTLHHNDLHFLKAMGTALCKTFMMVREGVPGAPPEVVRSIAEATFDCRTAWSTYGRFSDEYRRPRDYRLPSALPRYSPPLYSL